MTLPRTVVDGAKRYCGAGRTLRLGARVHRPRLPYLLGIVLAVAIGSSHPVAGAMERPSYTVGNRWTYELSASLGGLPGLNVTLNATVSMTLSARVVIDVHGMVERQVAGTAVRGVEAGIRTTGTLNGTFRTPDVPLLGILSGTLAHSGTEIWEDEGFLVVEADDETSFDLQVILVVSVPVSIRLRSYAATRVLLDRPFPLDVGNWTTASLTTDLEVNTTVIASGMEVSFENRTTFDSAWSRKVLSREPISVDAGTFDAYRLNQTVVSFPGLSVGLSLADGNETAWWSNAAGNYVRRTAYANGTRVAEMRLNSYSYGASEPSFPWLYLGPVAAAAAIGLILRSRRRRSRAVRKRPKGSRGGEPSAPGTSPRDGEDRAR